MRGKYYKLVGKTPVLCESTEDFVNSFDIKNRRVAETEEGEVSVSTVFLAVDHAFAGGPPILFETMIFGKGYEGGVNHGRYCTWDEAVEGHREACISVFGHVPEKESSKGDKSFIECMVDSMLGDENE